jgi:competence protein ComEC
MDKADIFFYLCLSLIAGVFVSSFLSIPRPFIFATAASGAVFCFFARKRKSFGAIGLCLIVFSAGIFHYSSSMERIRNNALTRLDGETVVVSGVVSDEVDRTLDKARITVDILSKSGTAVGRAMVYADKYADFKYRDRILIKGEAKVPEMIEDFDYPGYLAKDGISVTFVYPEIKLIENDYHSSFFQKAISFIYSIKDRARDEIKRDMPVKESAIMQGMILGDSNRMDSDFKQSLSASGLSHVIAISGSHIVLFAAMFFELLIFFGLWRKQAQAGVIVFTFIYVFLAGMLASAVRAWIMVSLMLLSQIIDRDSSGLRAMAFAAASMIAINPLILRYDLGFELSFLAVAGLIYAGPVFNHWLSYIFKDRLQPLREVVAMTMSAELFTFPVLASTFGYFSLVSFLANILVAPIVPLIMAAGILFPFLGIIFHPLGFIISLFCEMLVLLLVFVVEMSPRIPFAVLNVSLPFYALLLFYLPVFYLFVKAQGKKDLDFLRQ